MKEGHIQKLYKSTSDHFQTPKHFTVERGYTIKLASKPIDGQFFKNKYPMPNVDKLLDRVSQIVTDE